METQIHSFAFSKRDAGQVTLFGYATKSLPGLEINGLGRYGKTLKEKIIFLTRVRQLPIPLKRFVISTEYDLEQDPEILRWLDLPVLLMYWYLAGLIPLGRLDNCLAVGHITPSGDIHGRMDAILAQQARLSELMWLIPPGGEVGEFRIDLEELLGTIPDLRFKNIKTA